MQLTGVVNELVDNQTPVAGEVIYLHNIKLE